MCNILWFCSYLITASSHLFTASSHLSTASSHLFTASSHLFTASSHLFTAGSHLFTANSQTGEDHPQSMLPGSLQPPPIPPHLPSFEAVVANRGGMERESSNISGSCLNYRLTATPSAAGMNPPTTCPVTVCLLELYHECVENSVWACVLYEALDGMEKLAFLCRMKTPLRQTVR